MSSKMADRNSERAVASYEIAVGNSEMAVIIFRECLINCVKCDACSMTNIGENKHLI
jgi:hypothetical protein